MRRCLLPPLIQDDDPVLCSTCEKVYGHLHFMRSGVCITRSTGMMQYEQHA